MEMRPQQDLHSFKYVCTHDSKDNQFEGGGENKRERERERESESEREQRGERESRREREGARDRERKYLKRLHCLICFDE